jgi:hypothetical protein
VLTHPPDSLALDPAGSLEVHVTRDPHGGWQIDALRDGRVVASRHCDDWHRVERVRHELAAGLQRIPDAAAAAAGR